MGSRTDILRRAHLAAALIRIAIKIFIKFDEFIIMYTQNAVNARTL